MFELNGPSVTIARERDTTQGSVQTINADVQGHRATVLQMNTSANSPWCESVLQPKTVVSMLSEKNHQKRQNVP
jgi:hypothetical protein